MIYPDSEESGYKAVQEAVDAARAAGKNQVRQPASDRLYNGYFGRKRRK